MKFSSLILAICAASISVSAYAYKPGTYTASAQGQVGPIPVTVTFDADKITSIVVGENKETVGIGSEVAPKMADRILKYQSLGVDTMGGATSTSRGVINAVKDCVVQAGGDVAALEKKPDTKVTLKDESLSTDLVIIGGGGAGMISAINATQQGIKVILLEKMEFLGGASGICAGGMLIEGSQLQKDLGVTNDTPESFVEDLLANGNNLNNKDTLKVYANNVGQAVDWIVKQGAQLRTENGVEKTAEYKIPRMLYLKGGCPGYAQFLREKVRSCGADILLGTRATQIKMENGKATGVIAEGNGIKYNITAKAVLLATGGYGANKDMLEGNLKKTLYYGPMSSTGDGHKMAVAAGAKMQLMPYGKIYYNGLEVAPGIAKSTLTGNSTVLKIGAFMVDKNGNRVVNERGTGREIVSAQAKAPGGQLYLVMDKPTFEKFRNGIKANGVSELEVDKWLKENGKSAPLFVEGATLKEAADRAGINAANLQKTVERFNKFVKDGKDADFGRLPDYLTAEIATEGPYYIVEQKPRFATTMGSVYVTDKMQVLDKNGKVIPNLYAAGEIGNSVHGDDSAPAANVAWVATSSKLASDSIVKQIKGQ